MSDTVELLSDDDILSAIKIAKTFRDLFISKIFSEDNPE
jgi:hypothetical protein